MKTFILTTAVGLLAAAPVLAADAAQINRGHDTYTYWCAPCHAAGKFESDRMLAGTTSLTNKYKGEKPAVLEERTDLYPEFVTFVIRNGSEGMPFFRKTEVSDAQMNDIAAYLARNAK